MQTERAHPATQARLNAQARVGRCLRDYGTAQYLLGLGKVLAPFVEDSRREYQEAIHQLVEAARVEGAGLAALEKEATE